MGATHDDEKANMCCPTCNCLGYCTFRSNEAHNPPNVKRLANRSFNDFEISSQQGCSFCDVTLQSFLLLHSVEPNSRVDLLLYRKSPAEIQSTSRDDPYNVVEIYAQSDTKLLYPKLGDDVPRTTSLQASLHFLQNKYYHCIAEHDECRQQLISLPKRVVDISESRYRLVEPHIGTRALYATLSYCWGARGFPMTTLENYDSLKLGFSQDLLPKAFQDAAMIAHSLNIRYLWIDTLCIIQDSPRDWEEQSSKMGEIFEAATITIAASSSPDPSFSLFTPREPINEEIELYSEPGSEFVDIVFKARKKITSGIHAKTGQLLQADPLDMRAWALQEKILSTRLISFTKAEMQWTCRTLKACECRQNSSPSEPLFHALTGTSKMGRNMKYSKSWSQIVEQYSTRSLKVPEDKLPALSGLATKFCAVTGFRYIAGLWIENLLSELVWQCIAGTKIVCSTYLAPSFSWASVPGAVSFRFARYAYAGTRIPHTKIINFGYSTTHHNVYGRALDGSLGVRGNTVTAHLRFPAENTEAYELCIDNVIYLPRIDQTAACEFSIDTPIRFCASREDQEVSKLISCGTCVKNNGGQLEGMVKILSLYSIHHHKYLYQNFLILVKSLHDAHSYERVGVGTGKIYYGSGNEAHIPGDPQLVKPFEWLSVDLGKLGRRFDHAEEEVICIR
ncbi:heterokaryon incompatibility protein-domain-containing protein [Phaeosphaeriaceae sp. PMI808]|nr:heterokaryon incompatibility protein-domain-containing protein [Phaeosphaeriaceae sp. PMI808]